MISIIIPVAREGEDLYNRISSFDKRLKILFPEYGFRYEIIVVTDVFHRPTIKALMKLATEKIAICLVLTTRVGKGGSIKNVIPFARGDLIVLLDADLPVTPEMICNVSSIAFRKGADLLIANRVYRDHGILRRILSIAYNSIVNWLFQTRLSDHQAGFKILSKRAARIILVGRTRSEGFAYDTEAIVWAKKHKLRFMSVKVIWKECRGKSVFSTFRGLLSMAIDLALLRLLTISGKHLALKRVPVGHVIDLSCRCIRCHEYMTVVSVSGLKRYIFSLLRLIYIALIVGIKNEDTVDKP